MRGAAAIVLLAVACSANAEDRVADIRQGTNLTAALAPGGNTLVVGLLEQLWSLPAAGGGAVPLTPAGERARNPRFSPDGARVVYQRQSEEQWDLWLLDTATGEQQPLTTTPYDEREPDFTPDGRAVVFASDRTGRYCLWSITLDGHVETQLTEEVGAASFPTVAADGLIAYVLARTGEWSLRVRGTDGAISDLYTSVSRLSAPSWRPGGGVLVFGEQDSAATSRLQMLVLGEPRVLKSLTAGEDLFHSRAAWRSAAEFIYAADGQLWRRGIALPVREPVHLFAAATVEVATPPADLVAPESSAQTAFGINGLTRSRDGRRTAFTALGDVWIADRGEPRRLTDDVFVDLDPGFWPDGDAVVFASERTGQFELWRHSVRDDTLTQLTFGALLPRRPVVRPDGDVVAYLESTSLEPAATAVVKILDWQRRSERTVATDVVGARSLAWDADGRTLVVRARSAALADGADVRTDLADAPAATATNEQPLDVRWQPAAPPPDYVVEVGRLFDGVRATYHRHVDVHVRGGRIAAIVGRGVLPPVGPVLDAREATVIPGLVDLHAHHSSLVGERLGRAWLAYGVTTVRELAATPGEAVERAETWASGRAPGPRLIVSSAAPAAPEIEMGSFVRSYPGITQGLAHSLRRQARELGVPAWDLAAIPPRLRLDAAPSTLELELSPGFTAYQDGFGRLITSETTFVTGLAALAGLPSWPAPRPRRDDAATLFTQVEQAAWERPDVLAAALPSLELTVARLVRAGGRVAVGSDAPAVPYGLGVHLELALLARAGIPNDQVLRMATAGGALALGLERELGTLEPGKLADFVVVDGDPLTHIADTLRITAVAKGGVWHERASLLVTP
jgi:Tol biopolymer transport system component